MSRAYKFKSECVELAEKYARLGMKDVEMADLFGIDVRTLHRWKKKFPEFSEALKQGKAVSDAIVSESLYKAAIGGHFIEEEKAIIINGEVKIVTLKRQIPPNVTAQIFWLKNRQSPYWRDKVEADATVEVNAISLEWINKNFSIVMEKANVRQELLNEERAIELS